MGTVTAGNKIVIGDLTLIQTRYGITNTALYTTCQRALIVTLNSYNSGITIPAVGDVMTATAFNAIINAKALSELANGTKIYILETSGGSYILWYKVGNAGHYNANTIPLVRGAGVGTAKFNNTTSGSQATSNTYNISGTAYVRDTLNSTWYNTLLSSFKSKLVQTAVPTKGNAGSSTAVSNLSLYAWAPSLKELFNAGNAEGTQFPYLPPAINSSTAYWSRSVISGMANYAFLVLAANNGNNGNITTASSNQTRPVICVNKTSAVVAYSDGYRLVL